LATVANFQDAAALSLVVFIQSQMSLSNLHSAVRTMAPFGIAENHNIIFDCLPIKEGMKYIILFYNQSNDSNKISF
jgi:hypothetical protein